MDPIVDVLILQRADQALAFQAWFWVALAPENPEPCTTHKYPVLQNYFGATLQSEQYEPTIPLWASEEGGYNSLKVSAEGLPRSIILGLDQASYETCSL
jgi:hypothetical protein